MNRSVNQYGLETRNCKLVGKCLALMYDVLVETLVLGENIRVCHKSRNEIVKAAAEDTKDRRSCQACSSALHKPERSGCWSTLGKPFCISS